MMIAFFIVPAAAAPECCIEQGFLLSSALFPLSDGGYSLSLLVFLTNIYKELEAADYFRQQPVVAADSRYPGYLYPSAQHPLLSAVLLLKNPLSGNARQGVFQRQSQ